MSPNNCVCSLRRLHISTFSAVLDDQQNIRAIKELLQVLYVSLCSLVQDMGKSVLVGNINIWVHRMDNIMQWQQQLDNIQIKKVRSCNFGKFSSGRMWRNSLKQTKTLCFPSPVHIYRHDADWAACQPAAAHHAVPDGWQGPGQPGPSVPPAGDPHRGPASVEEALPVPLHGQAGRCKPREIPDRGWQVCDRCSSWAHSDCSKQMILSTHANHGLGSLTLT